MSAAAPLHHLGSPPYSSSSRSGGAGSVTALRAERFWAIASRAAPYWILAAVLLTTALAVQSVHEGVRDGVSGAEILLAVLGTVLAASLFLLFRAQVASRQRAEADAAQIRASQAALAQSEERFRQMAETVDDVFWVTDAAAKRLVYVSPAFERVFGFARGDVAALAKAWAAAVHPADRERVVAASEENESKGSYDETYRIIRPDGTVRWLRDRAYPLHDDTGRITGTVGLAEDVTDVVNAEESLRQRDEQLRQSQHMDAIGRLAAGVAHDFNNMLTAINGFSELAMERVGEDHAVHPHLREVRRAGERAAELTHQLLAFGRRQILDLRVIDLNEQIRETEALLRRLAGETIEFNVRLDADLAAVAADPGEVGRVVVNLVANACDAMPRGGKLTIETRNVVLDEHYAREHAEVVPGPHAMLAVSDTGVGMDQSVSARVFEPFFTTKPFGKGTGLGLSTVYGIVKQCRGHVAVYSEPGRGSTFKVYLPRSTEEAVPTVVPDTRPKDRTGTETVLVVEDDDIVRGFTTTVLRDAGYEAVSARHPSEAIEFASTHVDPIHLVISDVVMPGMSGPDLAEKLEAARPGISVLFVSGYTENAVVHHGLTARVPFLHKPFTPTDLLDRVRSILDAA
jgi:PAS domain S-box-containing protein